MDRRVLCRDRFYGLPILRWLCVLTLCFEAEARTAEPGGGPPPWHRTCGQMIVVVTETWDSPGGKMRCLERGPGGWEVKQDWADVTVGRKGLGLGIGLHANGLKGPRKREGDKRAPAGIFLIESGFGSGAFASSAIPYRQTTDDDFWVDDPNSRFYNQWVNVADPRVSRDWKSAEVLRRSDGIYECVIVVGHNRAPVTRGLGSAIFMHAWYGPHVPTIGCTAMEKERVKSLLQWLDSMKVPVLVQSPKALLPLLDLPVEVRGFLGQ